MTETEESQEAEATGLQESGEAEQETEETEEPETPKAEPVLETPKASELKLVILMKDDRIMLGVQSPSCDPVYKTMTGTLAAALKQLPGLVKEAKEKWSTAPKYPKADLPEPPPRPTPARTPTTPAAPAKPKVQPSFF